MFCFGSFDGFFEFFLIHVCFCFQTKVMMGDVMKEASFSLAEAKFATGNFSHIVLQNVNKAQIKVRSKNDNVAGENKVSTLTTC